MRAVLLFAGFALAAGCAGCAGLMPWSLGVAAVSSSSPSAGNNCEAFVTSFQGLCNPEQMARSPPNAGTELLVGLQQQRDYVAQHCGSSYAPAVERMDACLAEATTATQAADKSSAARLIVERPKVQDVLKDPAYGPALAEVRRLLNEQQLHCENAANARADKSRNVSLWQQRCRDARRRTNEANQRRGEIIERHGIELRDAETLGLTL